MNNFDPNDPFVGGRPINAGDLHDVADSLRERLAAERAKHANTMTSERRIALHDACANAIHSNGTVRLTARSAEALSDYLITLETLLQYVLDSTTLPDNLRKQITDLPMPTWTNNPDQP